MGTVDLEQRLQSGQGRLTRKGMFKERLEGSKEVSLMNVEVMSPPEKGNSKSKGLAS